MNQNNSLTDGPHAHEAVLPDRRDIVRSALRVTAIYTTIAVAWVISSDFILHLTLGSPEGMSLGQSAKGLLFVAVTASALYLALQRSNRRALETVDMLERHCRQIEQIRERWTEAFDAIRDPIMLHDGEFRVVRCNEAYARKVGRAYSEILGRPYFELFPPSERPHTPCPCVHGGEEAGEFSLPDGGVYSIFRYPVFGKDGSFEYCMHVFRDIGDSKRAQAALVRQGQHFRRLIENALDVIVVLDTRGNVQYISPSCYRVLGYAPNDLVGRSALHFMHPEDAPPVATALATAFTDAGALTSAQFRLRARDGSWRRLEGFGQTIPDEEGRLVAVINCRDVTERVETEARLLKVNRSLKTLIGVNNAMVRAKSEQVLLDMVCRVVVESADYQLTYVCYVSDDPAKNVQPMACHGAALQKIRALGLSWDQDERGQGLTGTAIRSGRTFVINDLEQDPVVRPWREWVVGQGLGSGIGLPLIEDGRPFGVLVICAAEKNHFDADQIALLEELAGDLSFGVVTLRNETKREEAERRALDHMSKLTDTMERTIEAVALTIEKRDPYTAGHQQRVAGLATVIAREMGLSEDQIRGIHLGGLIHDIGKVYVPAEILNRPGKLTDPEFAIIKTHCQVGYDIIKNVEFPWPVGQIVLQHHERLDGSGYPNGLKGTEILIEARIMAVADVVEAITSHRPYRAALGLQIGIDEITRNRGRLYDPDAVDACLRLMNRPGFSLDKL